MNKIIRNTLAGFMVITCGIAAVAQPTEQKILLTINNEPVTAGEFQGLYLKSTSIENAKPTREVLEDYLNLFINYKLKVKAAKDNGIDTTAAFKNEYQGYVEQLAQSYLIDNQVLNNLIEEAYNRMQYEVSASHILISIPENASPSDTLKCYQKAMEARSRILKGETFGSVAVAMSNDPSVSRNSGFLGYFTAFQMVYPFESAAYSTPVDSISMPVRTRFGYHIIKVHDKRPARGQVKVAHIMIRVPPNPSPQAAEDARLKILGIYQRLTAGADFAQLAKDESQDPSTSKSGGELPWIRPGQVIPEFEAVAFSLQHDGEISQPFQSSAGWHIVKRLAKKELGNREELIPEIRAMLMRDSRGMLPRTAFIENLKKEYSFKQDTSKLKLLIPLLDSSLYKGTWKSPNLKSNSTLISFNGNELKLSDFCNFIEQNQGLIGKHSIPAFLMNAYTEWVNLTLTSYEKSKLPDKYPEFAQLTREYYEGMLLFEISNREVWQKSSDSLGIANFYNEHQDSYKWGKRIHFSVYTLTDPKIKKAFVSGIEKRSKKGLTPLDYANRFNSPAKQVATVVEKSGDPTLPEVADYNSWPKKFSVRDTQNGGVVVVEVLDTTIGDVKPLTDCKGEVISDYQNSLEREWLEKLKKHYTVIVNRSVFDEISAWQNNNK